MKKMLLSMFAMAAFAVTFGGTMASTLNQQSTIWVYENNGDQTELEPACSGSGELCAKEYALNPDGSLGDPTGEERFGTRLTE